MVRVKRSNTQMTRDFLKELFFFSNQTKKVMFSGLVNARDAKNNFTTFNPPNWSQINNFFGLDISSHIPFMIIVGVYEIENRNGINKLFNFSEIQIASINCSIMFCINYIMYCTALTPLSYTKHEWILWLQSLHFLEDCNSSKYVQIYPVIIKSLCPINKNM